MMKRMKIFKLISSFKCFRSIQNEKHFCTIQALYVVPHASYVIASHLTVTANFQNAMTSPWWCILPLPVFRSCSSGAELTLLVINFKMFLNVQH